MIEVSEIKVMGKVPDGIDITPQKPFVALVPLSDEEIQGNHIIRVERHNICFCVLSFPRKRESILLIR